MQSSRTFKYWQQSMQWCGPLLALLLIAGCGSGDSDSPVIIQGLGGPDPAEADPFDGNAAVRLLGQWAALEESADREADAEAIIQTLVRLSSIASADELRVADLSEVEFKLLMPEKRLRKQQILVERVDQFREMTNALLDRATEHMTANELEEAEEILLAVQRWGEVNANENLVLVVQYSGKAVKAHAESHLSHVRELAEREGRQEPEEPRF